MQGIVIASHGTLAQGMENAAELFFGPIPQLKTVSLTAELRPEDFKQQLEQAVREVDTGDGVIVLCDLLGGTPCNTSAYFSSPSVRIIAGFNLAALLGIIADRQSGAEINLAETVASAREALADFSTMLESQSGTAT